MKYYVLQFKFLTPVHFGTAQNKKSGNLQSFNCCADTFFSALATEAAALDTALCGKFIAAVRDGSLLFSDLLPYYSGSEEEFYVPVPYYRSEKINTLDYGLSFTDLCLQYEARRDHENLAYIRAGGVGAGKTQLWLERRAAAYGFQGRRYGVLCKQLQLCGGRWAVLHCRFE